MGTIPSGCSARANRAILARHGARAAMPNPRGAAPRLAVMLGGVRGMPAPRTDGLRPDQVRPQRRDAPAPELGGQSRRFRDVPEWVGPPNVVLLPSHNSILVTRRP